MSMVTFYSLAASKKAQAESIDVELISILQAIRGDKWKGLVEGYRKLLESDADKNTLTSYKAKKVPCITVSGTFPNGRNANALGSHSGFIAIDFDRLDDIDQARAELYADRYTFAGFVSISGNGLCIIVKIDGKKHIESFRGLDQYYFKKYGYSIDQSCKDVSRLRFISSDPDLFLNKDSVTFKEYPATKRGRKPKLYNTPSNDSDIEYVVKQIEASRTDITSEYETWIEIAFALNDKMGDSGLPYFLRVSQFHPDFDENLATQKYRSCSGGSGVTISTFFHHAKKAGFDIVTPKTKLITTTAAWAKKSRRSPDQVVKQLQEIDGIAPSESEAIVKQVFDSDQKIDPEAEADTVVQVEEYIQRHRKIIYNQVTLKYEEGGQPLTDRDFNSIYIECKKIIPKVNKDLVFSVIDSEATQIINPLQDFFKKHAAKKPKGLIQQLADCIDSPTGFAADNFFPEFSYYFIRKWMIGAVAMWHKHHSPLMLVLAGSKQNTGKTHFFRYILPQELQPYYAESELTGDKDENLLMCNKALIMNDEMSNKTRRDIRVMKQLCSKQWFNLRKPYGRSNEDFRRIAALAGTSNSLEVLSDPTGNRRIIPIEINAINHEKYNAIDKAELWIEAYNAFMDGESFQLTSSDIDLLNVNTSEFEEASSELELLLKYFRTKGQNMTEMTATEIKDHIESRSEQRLSLKKLGMELVRMKCDFEFKKCDGITKKLYKLHRVPDF